MRSSRIALAAVLLGLAGCGGWLAPEGQGPQWIGRSVSALTDKLGAPQQKLPLPMPSLTTAYIYGAGAAPGFAVCEREYFVKGEAVIGYSEHGSAPGCNRVAGRTD